MSLKLNIANRFQATRPRHLMGNDPRKLVSHYEVKAPTFTPSFWCVAAIVFTAVFLLALAF